MHLLFPDASRPIGLFSASIIAQTGMTSNCRAISACIGRPARLKKTKEGACRPLLIYGEFESCSRNRNQKSSGWLGWRACCSSSQSALAPRHPCGPVVTIIFLECPRQISRPNAAKLCRSCQPPSTLCPTASQSRLRATGHAARMGRSRACRSPRRRHRPLEMTPLGWLRHLCRRARMLGPTSKTHQTPPLCLSLHLSNGHLAICRITPDAPALDLCRLT